MTPQNPTPAIWTSKWPDFKGGYHSEKVKVQVIGETEKSYHIKLRTGETKRVRKHNVTIPTETFERARPTITWLPYKDN